MCISTVPSGLSLSLSLSIYLLYLMFFQNSGPAAQEESLDQTIWGKKKKEQIINKKKGQSHVARKKTERERNAEPPFILQPSFIRTRPTSSSPSNLATQVTHTLPPTLDPFLPQRDLPIATANRQHVPREAPRHAPHHIRELPR